MIQKKKESNLRDLLKIAPVEVTPTPSEAIQEPQPRNSIIEDLMNDDSETDHFNFNQLIQQHSIMSRLTKPAAITPKFEESAGSTIFNRLKPSYRIEQDAKHNEAVIEREELVMKL